MSVYLGQLGRMVELKCPAQQQVTPAERYSFRPTLEGRTKAQVKPVGRRVWGLSTSEATTPAEAGALADFANGAWGRGPFVFVSADAPVTNLLTPEQASCDPAVLNGSAPTNSVAGPMLTPDGWAGRSFMNSTPAQLLWFGTGHTPVLPGQSVTASAYLLGAGAAVRLYFYDAAGATINSHTSTVTATAGTVVRSHVTRTAPANAVSCRVLAVNATQGARPAITWTASLFEWADGQGCTKAVIHGLSRNLVMASREASGGRYSNLSYTITEVG